MTMVNRETLRYGFYGAILAVILALTGVFTSFERNEVIDDVLLLSTVILTMMTFLTGYAVALQVQRQPVLSRVVNGAVGGLLVGGALTLLALLEENVNMNFVFPNLGDLAQTTLLMRQEDIIPGLLLLLLFSGVMGALAGLSLLLPASVRHRIFIGLMLTAVIGLLQNQLIAIISLPDALSLILAFGLAYVLCLRFLSAVPIMLRLGAGFLIGFAVGAVLALLAGSDTLAVARADRVLSNGLPWLPVIMGLVGLMGALVTAAPQSVHGGMFYFLVGLLVIGVLNSTREMSLAAAVVSFALIITAMWLAPRLGARAEQHFWTNSPTEKRLTNRTAALFGLLVMLIAPLFLGQYITSVFDLVGLYIIMGIGLNVMVGYAGLLDLGFVASFAIGAYAMGLMTTPSMLTCGWTPPAQITPDTVAEMCTGIMTFWEAWPFAALTAGLTGMLLGVPVLRLRGDYLAIVTLGFGEIINRLLLSTEFKPLLGGAQGITPIPQPVIDLTLPVVGRVFIQFGNAVNIYYVILFSTILVAAVVYRLANTRLGRAWRSIRADEDVAEAMGIHLVNNKLLAFGISSTLAGVGGAIFGAWLQGIFPNSFTLLVSINVLSLIIIGGLGSIPGVVVGSLILIGLPEVLRELQDYRLLAFGALLVLTMIVRPEGLVPPQVRRLSETVTEAEKEAPTEDHESTPEVSYG